MARLLHSLVLLNQLCGSDDLIHETHLASPATGHPVGLCITGHQFYGIGIFSAVEDPFPWDKDVVKDDHGGLSLPKERVSQFFYGTSLIPFCGIRRILAHIGNSFRVSGNGECYGVVLLPLVMCRLG